MKYMILTYGSQQDYDGMAGKATDKPAWTRGGLRGDGRVHGGVQQRAGRVRRARRDPGAGRAGAHPAGPAARTACRSSPTGRTPRPRRCWPATGSSSATSFDRATEIAARLAELPGPGARRGQRVRRRPADRRARRRARSCDRAVPGADVEDLLRELAPQVLGAVVRRYGHFDTAEDAVQEALLAAASSGRRDGVPDNPRGWLITVASRRLTDLLRGEQARQRREDTVAQWTLPDEWLGAGRRPAGAEADDTLDPAVPVLPPVAVAGVADRADAAGGRRPDHRRDRPGVPGAGGDHDPAHQPGQAEHQGQRRPVRACPRPPSAAERLGAVLHVLYLIFNEGYASTRARACTASSCRPRRSGWPGWCTGCCPTTARWPGCWR